MNKVIYLHIGMPKTGTSAIQVFLAQNIEGLLARGISYPALESLKIAKKGRVTSGNMGILSRALLPSFHADFPKDVDSDALLAQLQNKIQTSHSKKIILSSEFLTVVPEKGLIALYNTLKAYDMKIIIYLRAQEQFIQSVYAQRVKRHGEVESIEAFTQERLHEKSILNYYQLLNKFSNIFGKHNLIIKIYEKEQLQNNNLLDDFLDVIGLQPNHGFVTTKKWVNKTPKKTAINLSRVLNNFTSFPLVSRLISLTMKTSHRPFFSEKMMINSKLQNEIISTFSDSNSQLAKVYLNRDNGVLFIQQKLKN